MKSLHWSCRMRKRKFPMIMIRVASPHFLSAPSTRRTRLLWIFARWWKLSWKSPGRSRTTICPIRISTNWYVNNRRQDREKNCLPSFDSCPFLWTAHRFLPIEQNCVTPSSINTSSACPRQKSGMIHEFGHALHGILSDCKYNTLSGTAVARDFADVASSSFRCSTTSSSPSLLPIIMAWRRRTVTVLSLLEEKWAVCRARKWVGANLLPHDLPPSG